MGLLASLTAAVIGGCVGAPDEPFDDEEDVAGVDDAVVVENAVYRIQAVHSGKCIDVAGVSSANGANIYQWDCHTNANQQWELRHLGGDVFEAKAKHSGKCLDVSGPSTGNGANVHQWQCHGGANQRWRFEPVGSGEFRLVAQHSNKCLDVDGSSAENRANVHQWACHGGANQKFRLLRVGSGGGGSPPGGDAPSGGVTSGNPLSGKTFFVDPNTQAAQRERELRASGNTAEADLIRKISSQPAADWIGEWSGDVTSAVRNAVSRAGGNMPVFIAYNMYRRDCGGFSGGGAASPDAYRRWIDGFAAGIGASRAVVVLEPDALSLACDPAHFELLQYGITALKRNTNTYVYVDAGNANWHPPAEAARRLRSVGVGNADGFALNVSNYIETDRTVGYGRQISDAIGGKGFVVDTARNGRGAAPNAEWCNPPGRGLGVRPTTNTGDPRVHGFLWLKRPGESDGTCNGGPAAGQWFHAYALELARNAVF